MPNNLTDAEIKKALECCSKDDCDNCPNDFGNCYANLAGYALDLINRKDQEIELEELKDIIFKYNGNLAKQVAENESLKAEIERLKNHIQEGIDLAKQIPEMIELAKTEAYKECIEKVKEELKNIAKIDFQGGYYYLVGEAFFDNLLNELEEKRK